MVEAVAERSPVVDMPEPVLDGGVAFDQIAQQPAAYEAGGILDDVKNRLLHSRPGRTAVAFVTALGIGGAAEQFVMPTASASTATENSLVCGGVYSKAQAIRLANGAPDGCGHRDIGKAWAKVGITPQVIKTMHFGTINGLDNLTSEGRLHSPDRSLDKPLSLGPGDSIFTRPLSVWGDTNYPALIGYTEDGHEVAILEDCGNGEGHLVPPKPHHKRPKHHKPKKHPVPITGGKVFKDAQGNVISPFPTGIVEEDLNCTVNGKPETYPQVVMNAPTESLGNCDVGTEASVSETMLVNPDNWVSESGSVQSFKVPSKGETITFVNREKAITPPPPPPPPPPSTPPAPTESLSETPLTTLEPVFPGSPNQICVNAEQTNTDSSGHESTSAPYVDFEVVSGEGTVSGTFNDSDGNPNHLCATFTAGPDYGQTSEVDATAYSNDGGNEPPVVQQFTIATQQSSGF